jgi:hypothetical protein
VGRAVPAVHSRPQRRPSPRAGEIRLSHHQRGPVSLHDRGTCHVGCGPAANGYRESARHGRVVGAFDSRPEHALRRSGTSGVPRSHDRSTPDERRERCPT